MLSRFRKFVVIGAGAALLLAVTAGPLAAAGKTYTVSVNPFTLPYTGTSPQSSSFSFTFTNTTPSASINSVTLTAPTLYTITGLGNPAVTESSGNAGNYSATFNSTTITVTNLNPLSNGDSVTLYFSANINTSNVTCQNNVGTWVPTAYNGANLSGSVFSPTTTATTTIGTGLTPGGSTSYVDANGNTTVTVTNTSSTCVPVSITRNLNKVQVLKPSISGVPLVVYVKWDPELAQNPLPATKVDNNGSGNYSAIPWCTGTWNQSTPTDTSGVTWTSNGTSCLLGQQSNIAGSNTVQLQEWMYLLGDWGAQR